jgi:hypothetical protein
VSAVLSASSVVVDEPGVYDISVEDYFADPVPGGSISSSGARKLLPPSCPAKFRYEMDHPGPTKKREFDLGHAAHMLVLGAGAPIDVIDAANYRTKAAQAQQEAAHLRGDVPLLLHEYEQVQAMAAAIREHPVAGPLFNPDHGTPEVSLFWRDAPSGVMCRARIDWLPHQRPGRTIIVDYKTCRTADLDGLSRAVNDHGYHFQARWYLNGAQALGLADPDAVFIFIAQEKEPPYLVTPFELDSTALRIAEFKTRQALQVFTHCTETDRWPGYWDGEGAALLSLPPWAERAEGDI